MAIWWEWRIRRDLPYPGVDAVFSLSCLDLEDLGIVATLTGCCLRRIAAGKENEEWYPNATTIEPHKYLASIAPAVSRAGGFCSRGDNSPGSSNY